MTYLNAREALTYAVSRGMVLIYIVVLTGILLQLIGTTLFFDRMLGHSVENLLRFVFTTVGFVVTFVGSVALLFKLIADGTSHER
jgi:uncharacterized Tic20 family protein